MEYVRLWQLFHEQVRWPSKANREDTAPGQELDHNTHIEASCLALACMLVSWFVADMALFVVNMNSNALFTDFMGVTYLKSLSLLANLYCFLAFSRHYVIGQHEIWQERGWAMTSGWTQTLCFCCCCTWGMPSTNWAIMATQITFVSFLTQACIFSTVHMFSLRFKSGLWEGHSRT